MAPSSKVTIQAFRTLLCDEERECACGAEGRLCVCVRVYVRAHGSFCAKQGYGIQPRPAKGERALLLRLCTVQFSWRASPRCVCVWAVGVPRSVCVAGEVWFGRSGLIISCLIKGIALGEETGRGGCTAHLRVYLMETSLSLALSPLTRRVLQVFSDMTLRYTDRKSVV